MNAAAIPGGIPAPAAVMARRGGENFQVASRVLPRRIRERLLSVYGFARLVDELGDEFPGDRVGALDWLEDELRRAYDGQARHPLLVRLQATLRECALPHECFQRLIEANRVDQRVARYETWEQLLGYCRLSADPVGELVLGVFGRATPERIALSEKVCSALQLAEHWQDVAEDLRRDRIYLPAEDRERFGCSEEALARAHADWRVRGLIAYEVARTRELLEEGAPLIGTLHGGERVAVAAFVSGGHAALDAIARAGYDVLSAPPSASRARRAVALARTLAETGTRAKGAFPPASAERRG